MADKFMISKAVRASDLPAPARLVVLVLVDLADTDGTVPERFAPNLDELAAQTGLCRSTVAQHLAGLERLGWVKRSRIGRGKLTYELSAGGAPALRLVQELDSNSPGAGLNEALEVQELDREVQELDSNSPGAGLAPISPNHSNQEPYQELSLLPCQTVVQPPSKPKTDDLTFAEFWAAYPRKIAKGAARKAWAKAAKVTDPAEIIAGAKRYAAERAGQDPKFTPHASTWLNAERWTDEATPTSPPNGHRPYRNRENTKAYHEEML